MKSLAKARSTTATVVSATGALFALQHQAEATVIYSGIQNVTASLAGNGTVIKTLTGIGAKIVVARSGFFGFNNAVLYAPGGGFVLNGSQGLKKLGSGVAITAVPHQHSYGNLVFYQRTVRENGSWNKSQTGFAALQLPNGDLGWVRLEWTPPSGGTGPNNVTALDWAYEDSGGPITTPFENAPEPSRALLALAGLGALALRRRRKTA